MAAGTLVSVEEYLHTSYSPDCDYVDGEVLERNLGELEHSSTQGEIFYYLRHRYPELRRRLLPEQRVQVKVTRFRVPDICVLGDLWVLGEDAPREDIIGTPPILCIEILSPEDRMARVTERFNDYFEMGVPVCWLIDPVARHGWVATPGLLAEAPDGILRAGRIEMPLAEVLE